MRAPDLLTAKFAALADPTRRAIVARLAEGESTLSELARPFHMTVPAVAKHLKVLEAAGLVERGRSAQSRPTRLNSAALQDVSRWIERYRPFWESSFDRLDAHLKAPTPEPPHGE